MSSFILLGGALLCGIFSSVAANYARQGDLSKSKLWSWITAGIAAVLIILTLFIVVRSHVGAGEVAGAVEELAFGVMLSYILMTLVMVAVAALNILSAIQAGDNNKSKAMWYNIGAAITAFGGFVLALIIIIFFLNLRQ